MSSKEEFGDEIYTPRGSQGSAGTRQMSKVLTFQSGSRYPKDNIGLPGHVENGLYAPFGIPAGLTFTHQAKPNARGDKVVPSQPALWMLLPIDAPHLREYFKTKYPSSKAAASWTTDDLNGPGSKGFRSLTRNGSWGHRKTFAGDQAQEEQGREYHMNQSSFSFKETPNYDTSKFRGTSQSRSAPNSRTASPEPTVGRGTPNSSPQQRNNQRFNSRDSGFNRFRAKRPEGSPAFNRDIHSSAPEKHIREDPIEYQTNQKGLTSRAKDFTLEPKERVNILKEMLEKQRSKTLSQTSQYKSSYPQRNAVLSSAVSAPENVSHRFGRKTQNPEPFNRSRSHSPSGSRPYANRRSHSPYRPPVGRYQTKSSHGDTLVSRLKPTQNDAHNQDSLKREFPNSQTPFRSNSPNYGYTRQRRTHSSPSQFARQGDTEVIQQRKRSREDNERNEQDFSPTSPYRHPQQPLKGILKLSSDTPSSYFNARREPSHNPQRAYTDDLYHTPKRRPQTRISPETDRRKQATRPPTLVDRLMKSV